MRSRTEEGDGRGADISRPENMVRIRTLSMKLFCKTLSRQPSFVAGTLDGLPDASGDGVDEGCGEGLDAQIDGSQQAVVHQDDVAALATISATVIDRRYNANDNVSARCKPLQWQHEGSSSVAGLASGVLP